MKKARNYVVATLLLLFPLGVLAGDEGEPTDFDIYKQDGFVSVWVDLSSLINSKRVSQMKDGINMAVEYQLSLLRPRKVWGTETIAHTEGAFQLGFRLITEDFLFSDLTAEDSPDRHFLSLGQLHKFLADSISIRLAETEPLAEDKRYYIEAKLTCVSLTTFNLADGEQGEQADKSAVKWLFKGFLELTNFGRQDYEFQSRQFSLAELSTRR